MNVLKKICTILCAGIVIFNLYAKNADVGPLKEFEKIWEFRTRDKENQKEFASWWGNENAISRILSRLHMIHKGYQSVLDAACGFCMDYDALKRSCPKIQYYALDMSSTFVTLAQDRGINVELGRIESMPYEDSFVELVYVRHVLEHMPSYQEAIKEMVRVASKEVMIVFFITPDHNIHDKIAMINVGGYTTYQNRYSRTKMENFLKTLDRVKSFTWQEVKNKEECILHLIVE